MSPEDVGRYKSNNETKFLGEFSERAEASDAMRAGDYTKMVTYFDTTSPIWTNFRWPIKW
jgi:hypothetical protein